MGMEKHILRQESDIRTLTSMLDHVTDLVFLMEICDEQFVYRFINKRARQVLGLSDATIGKSILDAHPREKSISLHNAYLSAQAANQTVTFRQQVKTPDGLFTGESKLTPLFTESGELSHILGVVQDISHLHTNEQALALSIHNEQLQKIRMQSFINYNGRAVFELNPKGEFIQLNERVQEITGYTRKELLYTNFSPLIDPDDLEKTYDKFVRGFEGIYEEFQIRIRHKEGHTVHIRITNIPISVDDHVESLIGFAADVTTEVNLKEEAELNRQRYKSLFDFHPDGIIAYDLQGRLVDGNPAAQEITGYAYKNISDRSFLSFVVPEHVEEAARAFDECVQLKKSVRCSIGVYHEQGHVVYLSLVNIPIIVNEELIGIYGVFKDVSMERELNQSREKYKVITEHAFDVIKVFNRNGRADYLSPSLTTLLGYIPSEEVGKRFTDFIHPEDHVHLKKHLQSIVATHKHSTMELRVLHKEGHYLWMEINATPVIERNRVNNIITISRDISERYRTREELKQMAYHDHLSGLPNRRAFDDHLQQMIEARHEDETFALLLIDGNQFKQINDTYGHDAGDAVIAEMAKRISQPVSSKDMVARLGGDEIGILLQSVASRKHVEELMERITGNVDEPFFYKNHPIQIRIAIGAAFFPQDARDKKALFIAADNALYESKKTAATWYTFYDTL